MYVIAHRLAHAFSYTPKSTGLMHISHLDFLIGSHALVLVWKMNAPHVNGEWYMA